MADTADVKDEAAALAPAPTSTTVEPATNGAAEASTEVLTPEEARKGVKKLSA